MRYKQILLIFLILGFSIGIFPQIDTKPKVKCNYLLYLPQDYNIHNDSLPVNRLQKCNGNVIFTRLNNTGHGIQDIYERSEIYDWLKGQKNKKTIFNT